MFSKIPSVASPFFAVKYSVSNHLDCSALTCGAVFLCVRGRPAPYPKLPHSVLIKVPVPVTTSVMGDGTRKVTGIVNPLEVVWVRRC